MFAKKLPKDDSSDYIIYHPLGLTEFPPLGYHCEPIPSEGCVCVSIDPGIKNFAIRIENRLRNGQALPIYFDKIDFTQYGNTSEASGTAEVSPEILESVKKLFTDILHLLKSARLVIIERQMAVNVKSSKIFQHTLAFFLWNVDSFHYPCVITDVSPKLKGFMLGSPKGINKNGLKKWGIDRALEILNSRSDQSSARIILHHKGKSQTKGDDLADTVIQLEALILLWEGMSIANPQSLPAQIEIVEAQPCVQ